MQSPGAMDCHDPPRTLPRKPLESCPGAGGAQAWAGTTQGSRAFPLNQQTSRQPASTALPQHRSRPQTQRQPRPDLVTAGGRYD